MRWCPGVAIVAALAASHFPARADAPRVSKLTYTARGRDCPDESSFRALVVARIGRDPFVDGAEDAVAVELESNATASRGKLVVTRASKPPAERRFTEGPSACEALTEAIATAAALAIDPVAATSPKPPPPPTPQEPPPPASAPPPPADARERPPPPSPPPETPARLAVHANMITSWGLAPSATLGGEAGVGVRYGAFALFAEGRGETQVAGSRGSGGDRIEATVLAGGIAPCGHVRAFFACLPLRLGAMQGRAPDVLLPSLGSSFAAWIAPRAGLWANLGGGFALVSMLELVVPLVRTTLVIDGRPAWTAPSLGGAFALGVGYVTDSPP